MTDDLIDFKKANLIIDNAAIAGLKELNLSDLGMTDNDLNSLLPKIREKIPDILKLNLSGNQLRDLPDGMSDFTNLTHLVLNRNKLTEVSGNIRHLTKLKELCVGRNMLIALPNWVGELTNLTRLAVNNNSLVALPDTLQDLKNLEELYASKNLLTVLPEGFANLLQLRKSYLTDNPLTRDTMRWLGTNFGSRVVTNMSAFDNRVDHSVVLKRVYGPKYGVFLNKINGLGLGDFAVGEGTLEHMRSSKAVMVDFLKKVPVEHNCSAEIYLPTLKYLMNQVFDENSPVEERQSTLQKMATALGDCATPVKRFLEQTFIGEYASIGCNDEELIDELMTAIAFEEHIVRELSDELRENEKIEQVQGLVNSLFLEASETYDSNKVKIVGERRHFNSTTAYPDFAFSQVSDTLAYEFAKTCCKTSDSGVPLKDERGFYHLAPEKVRGITEGFHASLGNVSEREKYVKAYETHIEITLTAEDLSQYHNKEDVVHLLEIQDQKKELRALLIATENSGIDAAYEKYLAEKKAQISELKRKYMNEKPQVQQGNAQGMKGMLSPMNQNKRPRSPAGGGSSQENSPQRSAKRPKQQGPRQ